MPEWKEVTVADSIYSKVARRTRQNMNPIAILLGACLLSLGMAQRSQYAPRPVGTLQVLEQYTPAPAPGDTVPNRIGGVDENYAGPLQPAPGTMGDPYLTPHLPEWPREHQPFWYLNQQHIMNHRGQAQSGTGAAGAQPAAGSAQPAVGSVQPATDSVQPAIGSAQPGQGVQGIQDQNNQGFQGGQGFQGSQGGQGFQGQGFQGQGGQGFQGQGFQGAQGGQRFQGQRGQGFQGQGFQGQGFQQGPRQGQGFQGQRGQDFQGNQRFQGSGINSRLGDDETVVLGSQHHRTPLVKSRVDRPELGTQFRGPV